ncbi:sugar-binding transcriptional regulator [Bacillaceae bacterium S4-13-56]
MHDDKLSKLIEAAKLYYQFDMSQQKIAEKLGVSRPSVSRMLQQAKDQGIVQIKILDPTESTEQMERLLKKKFKLKDCKIASVPFFVDEIKAELGKTAASYLGEIVQDGDIIGTTWGTTIYEVAQRIQPKNVKSVTVVQLNGGVSYSETNTYASEILHFLSVAFNTVPHFLPLPAIVDNPVVANAILSDRHIRRVLDLGNQSNIAIYTVGDVNHKSTLFQAGYYSEQEFKELNKLGGVGDICSRIFDHNGRICDPKLDERTIGIQLSELRKKDYSILIAGGMEKVDGIIGALHGNYSNVLITDQYTAQILLQDGKEENKNAGTGAKEPY